MFLTNGKYKMKKYFVNSKIFFLIILVMLSTFLLCLFFILLPYFQSKSFIDISFEVKTKEFENNTYRIHYTLDESENIYNYARGNVVLSPSNNEEWTLVKFRILQDNDSFILKKFLLKISELRELKSCEGCNLFYIRNLRIGDSSYLTLSNESFEYISPSLKFINFDDTTSISIFEIIGDGQHPHFVLKDNLNIKSLSFISFSSIAIFIVVSIFFLLSLFVCLITHSKIRNLPDVFLAFSISVVLIIPISKINFSDVSKIENRKLAQFNGFFIENSFNKNFGVELENWFVDRFRYREQLISWYQKIKSFNFAKETSTEVYYENHWMFYKPFITTINSRFEDYQLTKIKNNLLMLLDWCNKNDIKLFFVISPVKENLYSDVNKSYAIRSDGTLAENFVKNIKKDFPNVVYPINEMQTLKNEDSRNLLVYKTDTHLSPFGAFNLYKYTTEFIGIKTKLNIDDFINKHNKVTLGYMPYINLGHNLNEVNSLNLMELDKIEEFLDYEYIDIPLNSIEDKGNLFYKCHNNVDSNDSVVILGDSYTESLFPYFCKDFKVVSKLRFNNGYDNNLFKFSRFKGIFLNEKPDYLVIVLAESHLIFLLDLF